MTDAIIYGCGKVGRTAYEWYKDKYNVLFFVDKNKCGEEYMGCAVYDPKELTNYADKKIIIAVSLWHCHFLYSNNMHFSCKELTFFAGGSQILDYVFLKTIALISNAKEYLEVGTYIGESINVMSEL